MVSDLSIKLNVIKPRKVVRANKAIRTRYRGLFPCRDTCNKEKRMTGATKLIMKSLSDMTARKMITPRKASLALPPILMYVRDNIVASKEMI